MSSIRRRKKRRKIRRLQRKQMTLHANISPTKQLILVAAPRLSSDNQQTSINKSENIQTTSSNASNNLIDPICLAMNDTEQSAVTAKPIKGQ